jgi:hypothetical protein
MDCVCVWGGGGRPNPKPIYVCTLVWAICLFASRPVLDGMFFSYYDVINIHFTMFEEKIMAPEIRFICHPFFAIHNFFHFWVILLIRVIC